MRRLRGLLLLLALLGIAGALRWWQAPASVSPEHIDEIFTRCGQGSSFACVSDGDSFRLGQRKIRVRGIDAPETGEKARCPEERVKADQARDALLDWLNRGPFTMTPKPGDSRDQYGRDLRIVTRNGKSVDDELIAKGLAHKYVNRKLDWCVSSIATPSKEPKA